MQAKTVKNNVHLHVVVQ